ncbi:MAG: hypothetical protein JSS79_13480 [Bacteroidetes bacterium]|nr:hypothetical protein [Bacteroidota bacterium]
MANPKLYRLLLLVVIGFFALPAMAQNTKGDKPASNQRSFFRIPRVKSKNKGGDKAFTRDISGRRRIRTKNKSSAVRAIQNKPLPFARKNPKEVNRVGKPIGGAPVRIRSKSAEIARNNIYPSYGPYVNNPSPRPRDNQRAYSNRKILAKINSLNTRRASAAGRGGYSSRSGLFLTRGRKNVYWGKFRKGERPITTDITGRPLRSKNFHSPGLAGIFSTDPYRGRRITGERAYNGTFRSGYVSSGRGGERAWRGNISGHAIRKPKPKDTQTPGQIFSVYPHQLSNTNSARGSGAVPTRRPGAKNGMAKFLSRLTAKRGRQGGGSNSRGFNNKGLPIDVRGPGQKTDLGTRRRNNGAGEKAFNSAGLNFSGSIKTRRPLKGGGSNTRGFNNGGVSIGTRAPGIGANMGNYSGRIKGGGKVFSQTGLSFPGSIKTRRPLKGGGSNTRGFNNGGVSIGTRAPGIGANMGNYSGRIKGGGKVFSQTGLSFSGSIKARRPQKGGGSNSGSWNNRGSAIDVRAPGMGANMGNYSGNIKGRRKTFGEQGGNFSGSIKARRPQKGGGSNSGFWNNGGIAINVRAPGMGASMGNYSGNIKGRVKTFGEQGGNYSGNIKARRPQKGGGSISGSWNNGGRPIIVRGAAPGAGRVGTFSGAYKMYQLTPGFAYQGETYRGSMRLKRQAKGGGSISGSWNNNGDPIAKRTYSPAALKIGVFSGNMKAKRPEKGGGSNSGHWNNNGEPIAKRTYSPAALKLGIYAGSIKAKKPEKGGGSISGKLWNNNEKAILVTAPKSADAREAGYSGKIKLPFFRKQYVRNPNAVKTALKSERPDKTVYQVAGLHIKVKQKDVGHNKVSAKRALPGERPGKNSVKAGEYEGRMKMLWAYKHNPSSNKKALSTIKPTDYFMKGNNFSGRARMQHYVRNPKSNIHALKVLAPGRAVARIKDYQGNTRMSKPSGKKLLPDAQFAHSFRNNTKKERTFLMNVKLVWTKLFRKNGTQPDAVKEKVRRPRYDKKEKELWKDLYD